MCHNLACKQMGLACKELAKGLQEACKGLAEGSHMSLWHHLVAHDCSVPRTSIVPALRHALACKGSSVRALGQTLSKFLFRNIKVLDILSSRGVDGPSDPPPRQSSLVLLSIRCEVWGECGGVGGWWCPWVVGSGGKLLVTLPDTLSQSVNVCQITY